MKILIIRISNLYLFDILLNRLPLFRFIILGPTQKYLRVPWTAEIKSVNPKGNQPWIFIGRADAEATILWPSDEKSWVIGKDPDAGKDWRQKEIQAAEDKKVR